MSTTRKTTPAAVARAVKRLTAARGYPPTILEVGELLGVDKTAAHRAVEAAQTAGVIERRAGLQRTMRVVQPGRKTS